MKHVRKEQLRKAVVSAFLIQAVNDELTDPRMLSYSITEG